MRQYTERLELRIAKALKARLHKEFINDPDEFKTEAQFIREVLELGLDALVDRDKGSSKGSTRTDWSSF
jgi:hypothetical protein